MLKKKKAALAALAVLALGNTMSASAGIDVNWEEYKGYVMTSQNLVTDSLYKKTLDAGTNRPIFIEDGIGLTSWINNFLGMRVTNKVSYNEKEAIYMNYSTSIDLEHPGINLSTTMEIETQPFENANVYTDGLWSPDTF